VGCGFVHAFFFGIEVEECADGLNVKIGETVVKDRITADRHQIGETVVKGLKKGDSIGQRIEVCALCDIKEKMRKPNPAEPDEDEAVVGNSYVYVRGEIIHGVRSDVRLFIGPKRIKREGGPKLGEPKFREDLPLIDRVINNKGQEHARLIDLTVGFLDMPVSKPRKPKADDAEPTESTTEPATV